MIPLASPKFLTIAALLLAAPLFAEEVAKRPNIVVIVSDDQGYADAGFQGFKTDAPTPNLDALAKDGVRCTRGYVTAPVCSPSRAGLMTGRYQERFGHHNNLVAEASRADGHMPFSETTLAQVLGKAGYTTAMVGKWHLGLQDRARPYERGFSDFFGIITGGHDYYKNNPDERPTGDGSYGARIERDGKGEKVVKYLTDAFADEAVRVVRQNKDNPFFLYLAFNAPHTPTQAPKEIVDAVPASVGDRQRRTYIGQIIAMDNAIGRVRAALKETGADKNTFIVFFSDNGGAKHAFYDNTPLRDHKGSLYEGGIRVPFLASYPGHIPAGSVCDVPVTALDVFATACGLAGTVPANRADLDSRDMLPVLSGTAKKAVHDTLYWDFPSFGSAVVEGDMKLVVTKDGATGLFDLGKDISEKKDLAASRPDEVKRLAAKLTAWKSGNARPIWGPGSTPAKGKAAKKAGDKPVVVEPAVE